MNSLHVICEVGKAEYAIPASDVFQMETFSGATPVPGSAAYVTGLIQVRGQVVPVLNLRMRFGLEPIPPNLETRVVVMKIAQRLVGILVDSAREVQSIPVEQFKTPPDVVRVQSGGFVKSIAQIKNRIIMLLDSEKVIGEEISNG